MALFRGRIDGFKFVICIKPRFNLFEKFIRVHLPFQVFAKKVPIYLKLTAFSISLVSIKTADSTENDLLNSITFSLVLLVFKIRLRRKFQFYSIRSNCYGYCWDFVFTFWPVFLVIVT